jgi:hypothetical protein
MARQFKMKVCARAEYNVYTFTLRPTRLQELVDGLPQCLEATRRDLTRFVAFLEQLDRPDDRQDESG